MKKIGTTVLYIILGYTALYSTIWLHELGHSLAYAHFACKTDVLHMHVPPHFANASPSPIDELCAAALEGWQQFYAGMAGIAVNLLLALFIWIVWRANVLTNSFIYFWCLFFLLSNLTEASTYLTINNLYLAGDLISVQEYNSTLRIPLFFLGLLLIYTIVITIINSPKKWQLSMAIFALITAFSMSGMRFLFAA